MHSDKGRLYAWLAFVGVFSAINYAARFSSGKPDKNVLYTYGAAISGLIEVAVILAIVLLIARGRPKREYFALRRPPSWARAAGLSVLVLAGVFVFAGILEPFLKPGQEQGLVPDKWEPAHAGAFVFNFVVVAVFAPVVEELTFRGLGFTLLLERFGRVAAVLLVGLLFGLAHGLVEALPVLAAFGAGLAYLRARTGSVYPGMVVHACFNALVLTLAVTT
jgi:membrane protease YdiL (CAAX protease family)